MKINVRYYSRTEELLNILTRGFGFFLSITALSLLVVFASLKGNEWHIVSFSLAKSYSCN